MIRRALHNDVNVVPRQQFAKIAILVRRLSIPAQAPGGTSRMVLIHVADGQNVAVTGGGLRVPRALAAATDERDARAVVGAGGNGGLVGLGGFKFALDIP